jgi:bacillithiol biosynthesis deacetylase BshB1
MKLDILAFAAHPDDIELSCSGTLMKHIDEGKKVGIVDLTQGELGSRGSVEIRHTESTESGKIMGLSARENLKMADCFFEINQENKIKIIQQIRRFRPEIVLANSIKDRHPDHGKAAKLVSEACFLSGLLKIETFWEGEKQEHYRPKVIYHYIQDRYIKPDFVVDVSDYFDRKMKSVMAFKSQFYDPHSREPITPISSEAFLDTVKGRMCDLGRDIGVKYGEGFTAERFVGVNGLFDLI